jgi:hypothetical protein
MLQVALWTTLQGCPAETGEPLWLRWLRLAVAHPLRSTLSFALFAWSLTIAHRALISRLPEIEPPRS